MEECFVIMPISVPQERLPLYHGDVKHFIHVYECLFMPAITKAGFQPIPPYTSGSEIIQADIINNLSKASLVLCDMSILNPNVFYEFGIRSALDKPVALVADETLESCPFDTHIIQCHQYNSSLKAYMMESQIDLLAKHLYEVQKKSKGRNGLWKYFGVSQSGVFSPESNTKEDRLDVIVQNIEFLKENSTRLEMQYVRLINIIENFGNDSSRSSSQYGLAGLNQTVPNIYNLMDFPKRNKNFFITSDNKTVFFKPDPPSMFDLLTPEEKQEKLSKEADTLKITQKNKRKNRTDT